MTGTDLRSPEHLIRARPPRDLDVPASTYRGIHTARAPTNFPITGGPISTYPELVQALASVKHAAAEANFEWAVTRPEP